MTPLPTGGSTHRTTDADIDDMVLGLYADWLMAQPEAGIFNGDMLVRRMEQCWRLDDFIAQLPEQLTHEARRVLGESYILNSNILV